MGKWSVVFIVALMLSRGHATAQHVNGIAETIYGTNGNDSFTVDQDDTVYTLGGGDYVGIYRHPRGTARGYGIVFLGDGNDIADCFTRCTVHGENGDDSLEMRAQSRGWLYGGPGNDILYSLPGGSPYVTIYMDGGSGTDYCLFADGNDVQINCEFVNE